ncbi:hypothetical protein AAFC00_006724 [Neodothiora populina]|uniref:Uncharacterized protein n=1 Tax=Neodothiora populina TaxID=2781224 RepID=A0ABR3PC93_9PEZI
MDAYISKAGEVEIREEKKCKSCANCPKRTTPKRFDEGWDDQDSLSSSWEEHRGVDAQAQQPERHRKTEQSRRRMPSRCSPSRMLKDEHRRRSQSISSNDSSSARDAVSCPPDIEEIDMYMPSVDHKWFTPGAISRLSTTETPQEEQDILLKQAIQDATTASSKPARSPKGCGYSCKLHEVRASGVKPVSTANEMIQVYQDAW